MSFVNVRRPYRAATYSGKRWSLSYQNRKAWTKAIGRNPGGSQAPPLTRWERVKLYIGLRLTRLHWRALRWALR